MVCEHVRRARRAHYHHTLTTRSHRYAVFRDGEHLCGVLDKPIIGTGGKNTVFCMLIRDFGARESGKAMGKLAKLAPRWLSNRCSAWMCSACSVESVPLLVYCRSSSCGLGGRFSAAAGDEQLSMHPRSFQGPDYTVVLCCVRTVGVLPQCTGRYTALFSDGDLTVCCCFFCRGFSIGVSDVMPTPTLVKFKSQLIADGCVVQCNGIV
jgi:hypothetical protein